MDPDNELSAFTLPQLMQEVQSRMDEMVFLGKINRTSDEEEMMAGFTGSTHSCIGLCEVGKEMIMGRISNDG